jgi:hypothetical protein
MIGKLSESGEWRNEQLRNSERVVTGRMNETFGESGEWENERLRNCGKEMN